MSQPPHRFPITEHVFIEWQSTSHRSQVPPKIWGLLKNPKQLLRWLYRATNCSAKLDSFAHVIYLSGTMCLTMLRGNKDIKHSNRLARIPRREINKVTWGYLGNWCHNSHFTVFNTWRTESFDQGGFSRNLKKIHNVLKDPCRRT